jgi:hypothetical protein
MKSNLTNVFMTFEEVENCTFEPNCGSMNPNSSKAVQEVVQAPGEFFDKLGVNFSTSNPKIYKKGILKKAQLLLKNGKTEESLLMMYEGFNVEKLYAHNEPKNYICWKKRDEIKAGTYMKAIPKIRLAQETQYKLFKDKHPYMFDVIEEFHKKSEEAIKDHPEKKGVYAEGFENLTMQAVYTEAWDLLNIHLKNKHIEFHHNKWKKEKKKSLKEMNKTLKEQMEDGFDDNYDGEEVDYRKIYKTIMCPLKDKCSKVKFRRWPMSSIKSFENFGKDCPYAHHPMELQFPETLSIRIKSWKFKAPVAKPNFKMSGALYNCTGCGNRCNLCQYQSAFKKMVESKGTIDQDKIDERKKEVDKSDRMFF